MSAFGPWMVLESNFRSFGGSWDVILGSWGLILMFLWGFGRSCLALGGSFWESWGHFVGHSWARRRFGWFLGAIWAPFSELLGTSRGDLGGFGLTFEDRLWLFSRNVCNYENA